MQDEKPTLIVILPDGETWSPLAGCEIVAVTQKALDLLRNDIKPDNIQDSEILARIGTYFIN